MPIKRNSLTGVTIDLINHCIIHMFVYMFHFLTFILKNLVTIKFTTIIIIIVQKRTTTITTTTKATRRCKYNCMCRKHLKFL